MFLGSTYEDLKQHRAEVERFLRALYFIVESMESWGASSMPALARSLDELQQCDIAIFIVAHRLGEITAREFRHAIRRGIKPYVFVIDEDHPWPYTHVDEDQRPVKQFKTEIRRYVTPMYFRSVDNLVAGVMVTLIRETERMRRTHSPPAISVDRFPVTPSPALPNHPPLCPVVRSGARRMVPPGLPQPATSWQPSPPAPPRTPTEAATPHQTHQPTPRKQVPHQRNGPDEPSVVPPEATTNPRVTLRETVPYALGRARDVVGGLEDRVFGQRPTHAVPPTVSGAVTGRDVVGLLPR